MPPTRVIGGATRIYGLLAATRAQHFPDRDVRAAVVVFTVIQREAFRTGGWRALIACWRRELWSLIRLRTVAAATVTLPPNSGGKRNLREVPMSFVSDCRAALRSLRMSPAYALTAVCTLALGIGANTAIFSVVDGVLFKPLPYPEADRLVAVAEVHPSGSRNTVSPAGFLNWQANARSFSAIGARQSVSAVLADNGDPEELRAARVSTTYFDVLGVAPVIGRSFAASDGQPGAACVAVVSDRLWARRWTRNPQLLGQLLRIGDSSCEVIGVLPPESVFDRLPHQLYLPLTYTQGNAPRGHFLTVIGRLNPGVTLAQADAEVRSLSDALNNVTPAKKGWTAIVDPWRATIVRTDARRLVLILFGAVGVLLLVACVNVAGLALSRASVRQREVSIRLALGAGARRLFSHFIAESLMVVTLGALVGLIAGQWMLSALTSVMPAGTLPAEAPIALDGRVLLFTGLLVAVVSVVFGTIPAWQSLRTRASEALRSEGRGTTAPASVRRMQSGLLVTQVALAMILVASASMLAVSFVRLSRVDPGFSPGGVLTFRLAMPQASPTPEQSVEFHARVLDELRRVGPIGAVGASASLPLRGWLFGTSVRVDGIALDDPARANVHIQPVVGDYFTALGIPVTSGRGFTDEDAQGTRRVAVVNETFVRRFIGDGIPGSVTGRRIFLGIGEDGKGGAAVPWDIIGVIGDVKTGGLAESGAGTPEVYVPHPQNPTPVMAYAVRARSADAIVPVNVVREAVARVNSGVPISAAMSMEDLIGDSVTVPRFRTWLVMGFAGVTLLVAAIGVYAVRVQAVTARRKEIGIRMALGATRSQVMRLMVRQGARPLIAGVLIGLAGAQLSAGAIEAWLFQVGTHDAGPIALAAAILGGAALLASWIPARRAARVEPLETLRQD
jgi:predicted permease